MADSPASVKMEREDKESAAIPEEKAGEPSAILPMTPESKQLAAVIATAVATAMAGKSASPDSSSSMVRYSAGGYCVFFCGNLIAFESKRLPLVTLSTAESEYVEATRCATEVAYIKELCRDFNIDLDTVPIMEDNTACIAISANPVHHQRTKHIAKYYHYCRDLVLAGGRRN